MVGGSCDRENRQHSSTLLEITMLFRLKSKYEVHMAIIIQPLEGHHVDG